MKMGILFLAVTLCACSAKVSGGSDSDPFPVPQAKPFVDEVTPGPSLDGEWKSSCVDSNFASQYPKVRIDETIAGRKVTRNEQQYSDSQCQVPGPQFTRKGTYRYVLNKGADTFEVEYQFDLPNGNYRVSENLRLIDNVLYVSNMVSGDAAADTALYRQNGSQQ